MVHALRDAAEVLAPAGILIDVRPLSATFPIDAVAGPLEMRAGEADASAMAGDDVAADRAAQEAADRGWLVPWRRAQFDIHYYWDTPDEMTECLRSGRRPKAVRPSLDRIAAAQRDVSARASRAARLRCTRRMQLGAYAKAGPA